VKLNLVFILILLFSSCAKTPTEEALEAVDIAQTYLSQDECQKAIDILEELGRQTDNAIYLQVLASAYACRAGFSEIDFIANDVEDIDSDAADLMKSLSILSLSYESEANSSQYQDILTALNILLTINSNQPSQSERNTTFGPRKAGDMGMQALFLTIVQFGKFLNFYGNVSATGVKGGGAANTDEQGPTASNCFVEYTYASATTYLTGAGGTCNNMASDDGHPNMSFAVADLATTKQRMCEGLMLVTNLIDILNNITISDNSSLGALADVVDTVNTIKTTAIAADASLGTLLNTTSQSTCETLVANNSEFDNLQYIYALIFETGLP
jgi:hypothetical protein